MHDNAPLVAVILPTFNRRALLPAAIRSVLGQTFRDWRLFVVNDGGEDVSDVVAGFGDPRIECHDRPHLGKAAALNYGLGLVRSKYVAYMDDDDLVYPDHLAGLVSLAEGKKAEFVYSDTLLVVVGPDGKERARNVENDQDVTFDDLRFSNKINHKQILHTKRLADETGPYDERLRILIDYDYVRRLAARTKPVHLRKVTGEHFLRLASDDRPGDIASISGLWVSDPAACGRSVAAVFEKDPAALADLYRDALLDRIRIRRMEDSMENVRNALERTRERLGTVETSLSYRVGRAFTAPLRLAVETVRRLRSPSP